MADGARERSGRGVAWAALALLAVLDVLVASDGGGATHPRTVVLVLLAHLLVAGLLLAGTRAGALAAGAGARAAAPLARALATLAAFGAGRGRGLALLLGLALGAAVLLHLGLVRVRVVRPLDPADLAPLGGLAFHAPGTLPGSEVGGDDSTLAVLEDGVRLGPAHAPHEDVRGLGHGRFCHWARGVLLSSSDGSDPRTNGRRYALEHDWAPGYLALGALVVLAAALNAARAARLLVWLDAAPPARVALGVAACALVFRLATLAHEGTGTFGGACVRGVPFSDAEGWDALAAAFAHGDARPTGWDARRPLYYLVLGSLYAWTGPSLAVARGLQCACGAAGAALLFDGVRRLAPRPVALAAGLAHALLLADARCGVTTLTEPLGSALGCASLWALALGVQRLAPGAPAPGAPAPGSPAPGTPAPGTTGRAAPAALGWGLPLAGAGALLALSNLARPLTLPALPVLPAVLWLVARRAGDRRAVAGGLALLAGGALVLAPWLVRQRVLFGISTISDNTAEALYGATSPEHGTWTQAVADLADPSLDVAGRVRFYGEGVSRNLREHAAWYAGSTLRNLWQGVWEGGQPPRWVVPFACLAFVLGGPAARRRPGVVALAAALSLPSLDPYGWLTSGPWLAGAGLALLARRPVALVAALHLATWAGVALLAMGGDRRFSHALVGTAAALGTWGAWQALARAAGASAAGPGDDRAPWDPRAARACGALALGLLALGLAGTTRAALRRGTPVPETRLAGADAAAWVERALREAGLEGAGAAALRGRLVVRRGEVRPGYVLRLGAGERVAHWSPLLAARPYPFALVSTWPALPEGWVALPGDGSDLRGGERVVVVGVPVRRPSFGGSLEAIAAWVEEPDGGPPRPLVTPGPAARTHVEGLSVGLR